MFTKISGNILAQIFFPIIAFIDYYILISFLALYKDITERNAGASLSIITLAFYAPIISIIAAPLTILLLVFLRKRDKHKIIGIIYSVFFLSLLICILIILFVWLTS